MVLPNETPDVIPEIAARYDVDYLLLEFVGEAVAAPASLSVILDNPPVFLRRVDVNLPDAVLYVIDD